MKKLHLHIGSPKTGTTAIQQTFHQNRDVLNSLGFHYPGKQDNHHFSFLATKANNEDLPRQFNSYNDKTLDEIRHYYFKNIENDFRSRFSEQIISTEYLFISDKKYIQNYLNYLNGFFDVVKVYLSLRNPEQCFSSLQQQGIKARSFINDPKGWKLKFRKVIEGWEKFVDVEVSEYEKGVDSCKTLCEKMGIDYKRLNKPSKESNTTLSIEQMLQLEKIQHYLYQNHEDKFKNHLGVIYQINASFTHKPQLQDWVKSVIYNNHREDLIWLKKEYDINFLQDYNEADELLDVTRFENGKATVRDVYKVPSEETVEKYETLVVDALLTKLVQIN